MPAFKKDDSVKIVIAHYYPHYVGKLAVIKSAHELPGDLYYYFLDIEGEIDVFACPGFCLQHYPVQPADRNKIWADTGYLEQRE